MNREIRENLITNSNIKQYLGLSSPEGDVYTPQLRPLLRTATTIDRVHPQTKERTKKLSIHLSTANCKVSRCVP